MRFKTKLYIFFSLTVLLPIALVSLLAVVIYSQIASNNAYEGLRQSIQDSTVFLEREADSLSTETASKLKYQPQMVNELLSGDAARSSFALGSIASDANGSYAAITDTGENVLNQTPASMQATDCGVSIRIPLNAAGVTNGYLIVTRRLDPQTLQTMLEKTGKEAALACGGGVQASTFTGADTANLSIDPLGPAEAKTAEQAINGRDYLTYQYALQIHGLGNKVAFIAGVPKAEISANRSLLFGAGLALITFTLFVATLLAFMVTKTITNPLSELTKAAVEAQEGNLDCRMDITTRDEVGVLASSFMKMCSRLRDHIQQLQESRVSMMRALTYASDILGSSYERHKLISVVTDTIQLATNARASAFYVISHEPDGINATPVKLVPEEFFTGENKRVIEDMILRTGTFTNGGLSTSLYDNHQFLMAPVIVQKQVSGALVAVVEGENATEEATCKIMQSLAVQTATAMENVNLNEALQEMVITDSLTGLRNNRYFNKRFTSEVEISLRHQTPLSLIIIDLDKFKLVNDNYGHPVGDEVLRRVGDLLKNNVRKSDIAARYGGEEFAILLPQTTKTTAAEVAEKLRTMATKLKIPSYPDIRISFSAGVASLPEDAPTEGELLRLADQATYKAKSMGRNRTEAA